MHPISALRTAALVALTTAALALPGCGPWARYRDDRSLTTTHDAAKALRITAHNGSIDVAVGSSDAVEIEAVLRGPTQVRLDDALVIAEADADGALHIYVDWPGAGRQRNESASFTVRLPGADGLDLSTSNGSITISGMSGLATLQTSNGRVKVKDHAGPIDASTSNGRITITDATSSVRAHTSNGSVTIVLADSATGPIDIDTSNGSVTLRVGKAFTGELTARTSNGSVNASGNMTGRITKLSKRHLQIQLGDSSQQSTIKTSNGRVDIFLAEGDAG